MAKLIAEIPKGRLHRLLGIPALYKPPRLRQLHAGTDNPPENR